MAASMLVWAAAATVGPGSVAKVQLPPWPPTYQMNLSTIIQPCNDSGPFDPAFGAKFGVADYDWSNQKQLWVNTKPMDCERLLVTQAELNRKINPKSRAFVYRNLVKALNWFGSVREKLDDPAYSGFFLKFDPKRKGRYHVPPCDTNYSPPKCSEFYHDQEQSPGHPKGDGSCKDNCDCGKNPCGEYLWDHRNGSILQEFLLEHYIGGPTGVDNPAIHGLFIDDGWTGGHPSEEDTHAVTDMGLSTVEVAKQVAGWRANEAAAQAKILRSKAYNWQLLNCEYFPNATHTCAGAPQTAPGREQNASAARAQCTTWMRGWGCPDSATPVGWRRTSELPAADKARALPAVALTDMALMFGFSRVSHHQPLASEGTLPAYMQDLASFLLVRGPYAWLGYGWQGCTSGDLHAYHGSGYAKWGTELDEDYGEPLERCHETAAGSEVFERKWSKATVQLDCKAWKGTIRMADGRVLQ